jgi:hypothetical protein
VKFGFLLLEPVAVRVVAVAGAAAFDLALLQGPAQPAPQRGGFRRFVAFGPAAQDLLAGQFA